MEFSGDFTVDGTPEELWKYFTDPDILSDCAPGCESMELRGSSELIAELAVGVGSVKPSFDVEAVVTECDKPRKLEIKGAGEASRNSFEVVAWQELHDNGDGTTTVTWEADAEVSGIIASMGERALGSVADNLIDDFFRDLESHARSGTPAESKLEAADVEETEAAAEPSASEADAGITGDVLGAVAATAGDDGPDVEVSSLFAGVGLGFLGGSLLRRLRDSGQQPPRPPRPAPVAETETETGRPQTRARAERPRRQTRRYPQENGGSDSLLLLALSAAIGAIGVLAWNQAQTRDTSDADSEPATSDELAADGQASGDGDVSAVRENGDAARQSVDEYSPDPESDDPLDRLESRP